MARLFLLIGISLLAAAALAAPLKWATTGACTAKGDRVVVGKANEPWVFPEDNWDFHPIRYTDTATVNTFTTQFSCTLKMEGVTSAYPSYDVASQTRYTDPGLLFYHAGIQFGKYRVLFSTVSKDIALYEDGVGFLAAHPAAIEEGNTYAVLVIHGITTLQVVVDQKLMLFYHFPEWKVKQMRTADKAEWTQYRKMGVFAMHCRATFDRINANMWEGGSVPGAWTTRRANLTTRQWHNWLWIFDGDEPVARFMKYDVGNHRNGPTDTGGPYRYFGISDAKLRPGTPPATPWQLDWECPLAGVGKARYKTLKRFEVTPAENGELLFRWESALQATGETTGRGTMTVRYDTAENRYIYDCRTARILDAPWTESVMHFADPWPYWAIGPATDDWKTWPRRLRYFVYTDEAGALRKIPLNHHWPTAYVMKPGTAALFVSDNDVNPAFELLTERQTVFGGLCNWGLDLHLQLKFTKEQLPLPKGKELTTHFRVTTYAANQAQAMLADAKFLDFFQQVYGKMLVPVNTGQLRNTFGPASWVKPTDPFDAWIWEGLTDKNWDQTVGDGDTYSLRLDKPGVYLTRNFGAGGYYGVFPKGTYELRARVKTQDAKGKGCWLSVQNWPAPETPASDPVTGTTDWTTLRVRFQGPIIGAILRLHLDGPGAAWVDNVQVVKVD